MKKSIIAVNIIVLICGALASPQQDDKQGVTGFVPGPSYVPLPARILLAGAQGCPAVEVCAFCYC